MIGVVGDLVEDIAVRLHSAVNVASDTAADIRRRRGGSAANTAVAVARLGRRSRFIGQVGDDSVGTMLIEALIGEGVEAAVRRGGDSGTIVVLIDSSGERTMLADRGTCTALTDPDPAWVDGLQVLHVPVYSLVGEPLTSTTLTLIGWARERGVQVSIDAASAAVIVERGVARTLADLTSISPDVLLCNELEAAALGGLDALTAIGARATVIKHGPRPATVVGSGGRLTEVDALPIEAVGDTTGAGDAFAAGFLVAWADGADPAACRHSRAHQRPRCDHSRDLTSTTWDLACGEWPDDAKADRELHGAWRWLLRWCRCWCRASPPPQRHEPRQRYLDPTFEVDVQRDVVYGQADAIDGSAVTLQLDLYTPRGDARPTVLCSCSRTAGSSSVATGR